MRGLKSTKTMENKINWKRLSNEPDQVILFILNSARILDHLNIGCGIFPWSEFSRECIIRIRILDHLNIGYRLASSHGQNFRESA